MVVKHIEVPKPPDKVIIEMTDLEACALTEFLERRMVKGVQGSVKKLSKELSELTRYW